jgi:hypothetical protein
MNIDRLDRLDRRRGLHLNRRQRLNRLHGMTWLRRLVLRRLIGGRGRRRWNLSHDADAADDAIEDAGDNPLAGELIFVDVIGEDQRLQNGFGHSTDKRGSAGREKPASVAAAPFCQTTPIPSMRQYRGQAGRRLSRAWR